MVDIPPETLIAIRALSFFEFFTTLRNKADQTLQDRLEDRILWLGIKIAHHKDTLALQLVKSLAECLCRQHSVSRTGQTTTCPTGEMQHKDM